jgi:imidazoleglycerol-phosphate dehydratase
VEDVAIVLGDAIREALGDKAGIARFGDALVPLDEALAQAVVDVSGRPYLVHVGEPAGYEHHLIGGHFTGSLVRHTFEAIAFHAGLTVHVRVLEGRDPHHIAEAEYKAFARAFRQAKALDPLVDGIPSTKGAL